MKREDVAGKSGSKHKFPYYVCVKIVKIVTKRNLNTTSCRPPKGEGKVEKRGRPKKEKAEEEEGSGEEDEKEEEEEEKANGTEEKEEEDEAKEAEDEN